MPKAVTEAEVGIKPSKNTVGRRRVRPEKEMMTPTRRKRAIMPSLCDEAYDVIVVTTESMASTTLSTTVMADGVANDVRVCGTGQCCGQRGRDVRLDGVKASYEEEMRGDGVKEEVQGKVHLHRCGRDAMHGA